MTFEAWLDAGRGAGWCGEVTCAAHDGTPLTEGEMAAADADGVDPLDVCCLVLRLFPEWAA